jgi:hypothetical protein
MQLVARRLAVEALQLLTASRSPRHQLEILEPTAALHAMTVAGPI